VEDKSLLINLFELKTFKKGNVISTPTSGISNFCIIVKGKIGLFYHKKVHNDYMIFTVL
jgi:hypothetical protein